MIYKLFPSKDATIYSYAPSLNSGIDEILEISSYLNPISSSKWAETSRTLIQFSSGSIQDIIGSISGSASSSFKTSLRLFLATADTIPVDFTVYCYPVSQSWNMGTGRFSNLPYTTNGVSWGYNTSYDVGGKWKTSSLNPFTAVSFSGSVGGGGNWLTGSSTLNPVSSQSFSYISSKDINMDVTNTILLWYSGSISNNGFIVKQDSAIEFTTSSLFSLKYFSMDTHTIYPPCLEFKWDDSVYSSSLTQVTGNRIEVGITNNKGKYTSDTIEKFRLSVRDQYPTRAFQTSSVYLNNKILPSSSYYSIKDLKTDEVVIDFDTNYTKISADNTSNYFFLAMNGLEPERNYQILIKSIISGETIIFRNSNFNFKVVK